MAIANITPYFLSAFLAGVLLRSFFEIPGNFVMFGLGLCGGIFIFALVLRIAPKKIFWIAFAIFFLAGVWRFSVFQKNVIADELHNRYGEILNIQGAVISGEAKEKSSRIILKTDLGNLLVITRPYPGYVYGDLLEITGKISEPEGRGDFDVKSYLAKDKIYAEAIFPEIRKTGYAPPSKILAGLLGLKERFQESLGRILPEPHSLLAKSMLFGKSGAMDKNLVDAFQKTGTVHILVLSGYNITVVGAFLLAVFGYILPQAFSWMFAVLGIVFFTLVTGAEPAAVRASIMAVIGLFALRAGRAKVASDASRMLLWAAFLMILWNPMYLRFDRGFQLSFAATLGLVLMAKHFSAFFKFLPRFFGIRESASASLAAQIFVLPFIMSWGNPVSIWSPLVNILVIGVVPVIMFSGFLGGLAGLVSRVLGVAAAGPAFLLISYQIHIVNFFAGL